MSRQFFSFTTGNSSLAKKGQRRLDWDEPRYTVKFMYRELRRGHSATGFLRQFPGTLPQWNTCRFEFDVDCQEYDWLVVYHDLPPEDRFFTEEKLACPREKTLLITAEPSTITVYGKDYLRQFGFILSFQEPWAMRHPRVIFHHPGLIWHYGLPYIVEARRRVLQEQNLFAIIDRTISEQDPRIRTSRPGGTIRNRATMRLKNPLAGLRSLAEKVAIKSYHRLTAHRRQRPLGL